MHKKITWAFILLVLCSCATQHKPIAGIRDYAFREAQFDSALDFSYADEVLKLTGNKRSERWAKRKNIHVIAVKITNNGKRPIHGTQLQLFNGEQPVEILQNEWLARKIRQRQSPFMLLTLPAMIIESAFWDQLEDDDELYTTTPLNEGPFISTLVADKEEKKRETANFNLGKELKKFQVSSMIYRPRQAVFGIIGIRTKRPLHQLHWTVKPTDLKIMGYTD